MQLSFQLLFSLCISIHYLINFQCYAFHNPWKLSSTSVSNERWTQPTSQDNKQPLPSSKSISETKQNVIDMLESNQTGQQELFEKFVDFLLQKQTEIISKLEAMDTN